MLLVFWFLNFLQFILSFLLRCADIFLMHHFDCASATIDNLTRSAQPPLIPKGPRTEADTEQNTRRFVTSGNDKEIPLQKTTCQSSHLRCPANVQRGCRDPLFLLSAVSNPPSPASDVSHSSTCPCQFSLSSSGPMSHCQL